MPHGRECDGDVLTLVYREEDKRSNRLILRAENLSAEPIASINALIRVPNGFHGHSVPGA